MNHGGYLKDRTGNRRFWVIRCDGPLAVEKHASLRDLLWAEARHLYDAGEIWHLDREEEATMREEHATRLEADPWEEVVAAWLAARRREPFTMNELLQSALRLGAHGRNPHVTRRVSRIVEMLGFERRRGAFHVGSGRGYAYISVRPEETDGPVCLTSPTAPLQPS